MLINPPEYGLRLWGDAEERGVVAAIRGRDGFRFGVEKSAADEVEERIARLIGIPECVATTNGTAALQAALFAVGVKPSDDVLVSALTYHATANAVLRLGARPIPIDLDLDTNLSLDDLRLARSARTSAVVAVHWPGLAFGLGAVAEFCREQGLALVEDACQAFCAKSPSGYAGTEGAVGVYSFQQNKLITSGEGGALVVRDPEIARRARAFVDQGVERRDGLPVPGGVVLPGADNLRLTGIQAAILNSQFAKLEELLRDLRLRKARFAELLEECGIREWSAYTAESTGQVFALRFATADSAVAVTSAGARCGVMLRPIWQSLFHEAYGGRSHGSRRCPQARDVLERVRLLPLPHGIDDDVMSEIVAFCATVAEKCVG